MKTSARIFMILVMFFVIIAVVYSFLTATRAPLGIETVGAPAFVMLVLFSAMVGLYFRSNAKKFPNRPEDTPNAPVEAEAGVQGSFAPYSWWPLWTSLGAAMAFLGVAAGWWILALGVVPAVIGIVGWVMEFSTGQHRH